MIIEMIEVGPFASNSYIVGAESNKEGMIIDPGADANKILKRVEDLGLEIKFIVLTRRILLPIVLWLILWCPTHL